VARPQMSDAKDYALGYSSEEAKRLAQQAEVLEPLTEDLFRRAGIAPGMRVLDLGCGVGDVSMLAARLVGPTGSVLGIDRSEASLETARRRVRIAGLDNVAFLMTEIDGFDPTEAFDAIVGRLVLLYLPSPSATIKRLARGVRHGGPVVFQEMDMSAFQVVPAASLAERTSGWIRSAFSAGGVPVDMGPRLPGIFIDAGLPRPRMLAGQRVESGPDSFAYAYCAATVRSLLPLLERAGLATAVDVGIDTLEARLRAEAAAPGVVIYLPRMVGAWSRVPGS
jgi:SAM-dependent methyltransferase